jgi:capsular polysaccharide transport system ATP-binding protein
MIELRNLTKYYPIPHGVRYIVRDVSLTLPDNCNLADLGSNGAGKSTLLRLIGGAEAPNSGEILTDKSISWPLGIGSGFQGSLSGRDNVLFVCRINGLKPAQIRKVINEVMEFAELREYFDLPVRTYSSGMRARLSFGLSMAFEFDVYLIDELTSVGDAIFRSKARKAFEKLRSRASLIFVSHNLQTLRQSCDSALFLNGGEATFFPEIQDGIDAYQDFIHENKEANTQEMKALKRLKRATRREKRRLRVQPPGAKH